jgi:hypothetical protein
VSGCCSRLPDVACFVVLQVLGKTGKLCTALDDCALIVLLTASGLWRDDTPEDQGFALDDMLLCLGFSMGCVDMLWNTQGCASSTW